MLLGASRAERGDDAVVVVHRVQVGNETVGRAVVENQLAAAGDERRQIRIHRFGGVGVDLLRASEIPVELERRRIPRRIAEHDVAKIARADRELRRSVGRPQRLAAEPGARIHDEPRAIDDTAIDALRRRDLVRCEALAGRRRSALQARRIERALQGIADHAVAHTVLHIARRDGAFLQQPELVDTEASGAHLALNQYARRHQRRPVVGRRAGDDGVVIVRKTLCFLQALSAAGRAAVPVRLLGSATIARRGDRLTGDRQLVHCAILIVGELLGLTRRPREIPCRSFVTGVGIGDGIAACQWVGERFVDDRARGSAVAGLHERPFHAASGSHSSNRMSEAVDGLIEPATRQNAGSFE